MLFFVLYCTIYTICKNIDTFYNIKTAKPISEMFDQSLSLEDIAKKVTGDENVEILEQDLDVLYQCDCSREKIEKGILSLGKEEISKIMEEDGKIDAKCHFCHKKYHFTEDDLKKLVNY